MSNRLLSYDGQSEIWTLYHRDDAVAHKQNMPTKHAVIRSKNVSSLLALMAPDE